MYVATDKMWVVWISDTDIRVYEELVIIRILGYYLLLFLKI